MVKEIKKAKISKKTNRKQNFKKFIDSNYTDIQSFLNACKNDENLLIYTCLKPDELQEQINKMKQIEGFDNQLKFLVDNQPIMNKDVERFNKVTESIAKYLKGYIEYNGWKMSNSQGNNEDWSSEFWAKYCKICDFYRTRWFYPEKLKKASTVSFNPMLYKEFIYICRMSITGERKVRAFKATQDEDASINKISLDNKIEGDGNSHTEKSLAEMIPDENRSSAIMFDNANVNSILKKALELAEKYPESEKIYDKIKDFYEKQDLVGFDKKTIMLGKIFLYKAGLVSPKILAFIKSLSSTYKSRYNISSARINTQLQELKGIKVYKPIKKKNKDLTWRDLILHKRGEL